MTKTGQLRTPEVCGFEDYDVERELNAGNFARVYKVREKVTGKRYAAKFIEKTQLTLVDHENVKREVTSPPHSLTHTHVPLPIEVPPLK